MTADVLSFPHHRDVGSQEFADQPATDFLPTKPRGAYYAHGRIGDLIALYAIDSHGRRIVECYAETHDQATKAIALLWAWLDAVDPVGLEMVR